MSHSPLWHRRNINHKSEIQFFVLLFMKYKSHKATSFRLANLHFDNEVSVAPVLCSCCQSIVQMGWSWGTPSVVGFTLVVGVALGVVGYLWGGDSTASDDNRRRQQRPGAAQPSQRNAPSDSPQMRQVAASSNVDVEVVTVEICS